MCGNNPYRVSNNCCCGFPGLSLALQPWADISKRLRGFCLKSRTLGLDTISTGSGSDLVSDQRALFPKILDSDRLTRSLPLPVLTVSKDDF
jgi:hypothetical protein